MDLDTGNETVNDCLLEEQIEEGQAAVFEAGFEEENLSDGKLSNTDEPKVDPNEVGSKIDYGRNQNEVSHIQKEEFIKRDRKKTIEKAKSVASTEIDDSWFTKESPNLIVHQSEEILRVLILGTFDNFNAHFENMFVSLLLYFCFVNLNLISLNSIWSTNENWNGHNGLNHE